MIRERVYKYAMSVLNSSLSESDGLDTAILERIPYIIVYACLPWHKFSIRKIYASSFTDKCQLSAYEKLYDPIVNASSLMPFPSRGGYDAEEVLLLHIPD